MAEKKTPGDDEIRAAIENLRDVMIAAGRDPDLVDGQLFAALPNTTHLIGNFADLQRLGAMQAPRSGGIADAFEVNPAAVPTTEG